jgi:uncharacterized Zn finger protein
MTSSNPNTWLSEQILASFHLIGIQPYLEAGFELVRKKRLIDFVVSPGEITLKIQAEQVQPYVSTLIVPRIDMEKWNEVYAELSKQALYISLLLSGDLPSELQHVFSKLGLEIFPSSLEKINFTCSCKKNLPVCEHIAALYFVMNERFADNPFLIFRLLGSGKHEVISEIRKRRHGLLTSHISRAEDTLSTDSASLTLSEDLLKHFWDSGESISSLRYNIRADELPGAILRQLDALPIDNIEPGLESSLEDAYEHVATRAQAFGLGLATTK